MTVTRGRLAWVQRRPHKPHDEGSTPSRATLLDALLALLLALGCVAVLGALALVVEP